MEAVAAVSSIAGILSLVGQSVNGIIALRSFFQDCAAASPSIKQFLKRLNNLIQILEDVRDLMRKLENAPRVAVGGYILASLQVQIDDCSQDVYKWLAMARKCHPASSTGTKASFKKFLVALERQKITDIYVEIATYKDNITSKLSMIGRYMDIEHSTTLDTLTTKLAAISGEGELESYLTPDDNPYYPSTTYDVNYGRKTPGSAGSIASIAKSLERIESKMSDWIGPQDSGNDMHDSQSGYGDGIGSNRISYQPEYHEVSMSSGGAYERRSRRKRRSYYYPAGASAWEWSKEYERSTFHRQDSEGNLEYAYAYPEVSYLETNPTQPQSTALSHVFTEKSSSEPQTTPWIYKNNNHGLYRILPSTQVSEIISPHLPEVPCLNWHYSEITQQEYSPFDPQITKYIDLILLSELTKFKIDLFKMTPTVLLGSSDMAVQKEIQSLEIQAVSIDTEAEAVRLFLWSNGCDTLELDNHLALCRKSEPGVPPLVSSDVKDVGLQGNSERKILSRSDSDSRTGMDASQQDRINMWLLRNLQESSEKIRHRSFLTDAENLDEEKWAKLVLKYWWLDDAAVVSENEPLSTNGAVDSAGRCHSVRVIFHGKAISEPGESVRRTETLSKIPHAGPVRQPKLRTAPGKFNKPRWRV